MKNFISKFLPIIILVLLILIGKNKIDNRTYDYKPEVEVALSNYFVSGDDTGLDNVLNLLDKYKGNDSMRKSIQDYSFNIAYSYFIYVQDKYVCSSDNYRINHNSCSAQLEEFTNLRDKLTKLYSYRSDKNGYSIISNSNYNTLVSKSKNYITNLETWVKSSSNPKNSEELRIQKCDSLKVDTDCENCGNDGICTCYYNGDAGRESLKCKKDIAQ